MDKFVALEPTKLHGGGSSQKSGKKYAATKPPPVPHIGRLPHTLHAIIFEFLPTYAIPSYALCSRATSIITRNESVWQRKLDALMLGKNSANAKVYESLLDGLEVRKLQEQKNQQRQVDKDVADDDFGDFAQVNNNVFGSFVIPISLSYVNSTASNPNRTSYIRVHGLLRGVIQPLSSTPHSFLETIPTSSTHHTALTLHLISAFLSSTIQPVKNWLWLSSNLRTAIDRFEGTLLAAFDAADSANDEEAMREAATSSWEVCPEADQEKWECGRVWTEKREIFYEQGQWDPVDNFTRDGKLDFKAMDRFMAHVLAALRSDGSLALRVFPRSAGVLLLFMERLTNDVVGEYITPLLNHARALSAANTNSKSGIWRSTFLAAAAACFTQAWSLVDTVFSMDSKADKTMTEAIVYRMFEPNMDEYLDEEIEDIKITFERITKSWSRTMATQQAPAQSTFLTSANPAQVKRNLLNSFTNVLLLPVTIVPRLGTAVIGGVTGVGDAAVQGIAMLNPQRWVGGGSSAAYGAEGYSKSIGVSVFEAADDDEDEDNDFVNEKEKDDDSTFSSMHTSTAPTSVAQSSEISLSSTAPSTPTTATVIGQKLELLLSLDTALALMHASRQSLSRCATFAGYPGHYGTRVHDTIEEEFVLLLNAMGEGHIAPGFSAATQRMLAYNPAEHEESTRVAPLLQFFELVHVGDTMQSMVQVFFDREIGPHIDKTDFLSGVVREKKRFENALDDSVAAGLNAGTEVLMAQVEHLIQSHTPPRAYSPADDGGALDLAPTLGCTKAIKCLETHCILLKGSTTREVLEVFYAEVGLRLIGILQKHIKRHIISLTGGFQVICDLNAYHAFIATLKIPQISSDFAHLKMLGHVYVVEDAKDLAQIVRDVTRYGGAYRPEDVYEFIQRRSDWKRIEKTVDSTMYNLSFKEDCNLM